MPTSQHKVSVKGYGVIMHLRKNGIANRSRIPVNSVVWIPLYLLLSWLIVFRADWGDQPVLGWIVMAIICVVVASLSFACLCHSGLIRLSGKKHFNGPVALFFGVSSLVAIILGGVAASSINSIGSDRTPMRLISIQGVPTVVKFDKNMVLFR